MTKYVLRTKDTKRYIDRNNHYCSDIEQARVFNSLLEAGIHGEPLAGTCDILPVEVTITLEHKPLMFADQFVSNYTEHSMTLSKLPSDGMMVATLPETSWDVYLG